MISRPIFLNEIENSENLALLLSVTLEAMKLKIKKN